MAGQLARDRRHALAPPRKLYLKELLQAFALADRLLDAPDVRHLHAHFAHGTTTVTWLAACITGLPFSFTGHARDIYSWKLNRKGWLRRKLLAARFVVTCTEANVRHLRAIAPDADVHLVYHGLSADFTTLLQGRQIAAAQRPAADPRRRPARGQEGLRHARRRVRRPARPRRPVRRADRRPGRQGRRGAAARRSPSSTCRCELPGPVGPEALLDEYRRAGALCMPCRLLPTDRDGIPNVLVEAMAAGAPVVATAVSGIPELVEHEVNGLLIPPDDPEALADALLRLHDDPELTATLTRNGRETVAERFDGERLAQRAGGAVHRGGGAVSALTVTRPRPVFCVNEHEHRDRELAEAVAGGASPSPAKPARSASSPTG